MKHDPYYHSDRYRAVCDESWNIGHTILDYDDENDVYRKSWYPGPSPELRAAWCIPEHVSNADEYYQAHLAAACPGCGCPTERDAVETYLTDGILPIEHNIAADVVLYDLRVRRGMASADALAAFLAAFTAPPHQGAIDYAKETLADLEARLELPVDHPDRLVAHRCPAAGRPALLSSRNIDTAALLSTLDEDDSLLADTITGYGHRTAYMRERTKVAIALIRAYQLRYPNATQIAIDRKCLRGICRWDYVALRDALIGLGVLGPAVKIGNSYSKSATVYLLPAKVTPVTSDTLTETMKSNAARQA